MKKDENDFLKEIQQKINKRSGGLYYNKQIKRFKTSLIITMSAFILVLILFLILRVLSIRTVEKLDTVVNKKVEKKIKKIKKLKFRKIKIEKESIRYSFSNIKKEDFSILKKIVKKYDFIIKNDKFTLLIPQKDKNMLLKRFSEMNFSIRKERYIQNGSNEEFIFDKKIFE